MESFFIICLFLSPLLNITGMMFDKIIICDGNFFSLDVAAAKELKGFVFFVKNNFNKPLKLTVIHCRF